MDYTKERKSKLIQICPKCGRKGRKRQAPTASNGQRYSMYVHADKIVTVAGIQFNHIDDYCHVAESQVVGGLA